MRRIGGAAPFSSAATVWFIALAAMAEAVQAGQDLVAEIVADWPGDAPARRGVSPSRPTGLGPCCKA